MKIFEADSFNEFLNAQFEERRHRNPRYSLRSFARNLGLSHSRLSEILNGQTISISSAQAICEVLRLRPTETAYLIDLVRASSGRTEKVRAEARARLELKKMRREFQHNKSGNFLLSKWYYAALIEFLTGTHLTSPKIAETLHLSSHEFETAVQELQARGFIRREDDKDGGAWIKVDGYLKFESPVPSQLVQDFHRASLSRATKALDQAIETRKFLTYVMTVRPDQIEDAREELENFAANFAKKFSDSETHEGLVYSFGLQFFAF
jgi:uncharacterized protein (TIGR02147 family)